MMDCCGAPPQRIFAFGRGLFHFSKGLKPEAYPIQRQHALERCLPHDVDEFLQPVLVGVLRQDALARCLGHCGALPGVRQIMLHQIRDGLGGSWKQTTSLSGSKSFSICERQSVSKNAPVGRNVENTLIHRAFHLFAGAVEVDIATRIKAWQVLRSN